MMKELGLSALMFVIITFIISLGGTMMGELSGINALSDSSCGVNGTAAYNTTCKGFEGIESFSNFLPLVAIVAVLAIIIGILLYYLAPVIGL